MLGKQGVMGLRVTIMGSFRKWKIKHANGWRVRLKSEKLNG
jgi:hypothetical protein